MVAVGAFRLVSSGVVFGFLISLYSSIFTLRLGGAVWGGRNDEAIRCVRRRKSPLISKTH